MKRRLIVPLLVSLTACIISRGFHVDRVALPRTAGDTVIVRSAVKAHLIDGSTVLFRTGLEVSRDSAWGSGMRYGLTLRDSAPVAKLPLDSVVGMESYRTQVNPMRTVLYSYLATTAVVLGAVAIACAADPKCFGSCPTFYADSAGVPVLEAEGFSTALPSFSRPVTSIVCVSLPTRTASCGWKCGTRLSRRITSITWSCSRCGTPRTKWPCLTSGIGHLSSRRSHRR